MPQTDKKMVSCPVETTLRIIGGKWKVLVIHALLDGTLRFSEVHRSLPKISHRTLSKQLGELESDGVISRKVFQQIPPKVEYSLTAMGRELHPALMAMQEWGEAVNRKKDRRVDGMKTRPESADGQGG